MAAIETLRLHAFVEQNRLIIAVELVKYLKRHITTASREERALGLNPFKRKAIKELFYPRLTLDW